MVFSLLQIDRLDAKNHEFAGDIYRIQNNLPLEGESHNRYLASKPPIRKNKDYRARPRNYFTGFPVYKKDNYTRHWYNFKDILSNNEHPVPKHFKQLIATYITSLSIVTGLRIVFDNFNPLNEHVRSLSGNYHPIKGYGTEFSNLFKRNGAMASALALGGTSFSFLRNYLM